MKGLLKGIVSAALAVVFVVGITTCLKAATVQEVVLDQEMELMFPYDTEQEFILELRTAPGKSGYYTIELTSSVDVTISLRYDDKDLIGSRNGTNISYSEELNDGHYYTYRITGTSTSSYFSTVKVKVFYIDPLSPDVMEVNEQAFPDADFRNHVLTYYDIDGDMILSEDEIKHANVLEHAGFSFRDITGVKYLSSLQRISLNSNLLTSLDVSGMESLEYLSCTYGNKLETVDCSGCKNLKKIYFQGNEKLAKADISGCENLILINFNKGNLEKLDVSFCKNLEDLGFGDQPNIKEMDLSNNTKLKRVYCSNTKLDSLDLSNNGELEDLTCAHCGLTDLDLSYNPKLVELSCSDNALTFLDTSNCRALTEIYCEFNPFKDDTVYIPNRFVKHTTGSTYKYVVIEPTDWTFGGINWTEDHKATASYSCSKIDGYKLDLNMKVVRTYTPASCDKDGSDGYKATIASDIARDGIARDDSKTIDLPKTGHDWGDWKVTTKASVGKDGEETRICRNDTSHKQTRKIAALTPTPTDKPVVKPTAKPTKAPTKAASVTIKLDKSKADIICGKDLTLKATVKGTKQAVTWKSSDTKVATVDKNGKITAKMAGAVTVTATVAGKTATCKVTVLYKDVTNSKDFWFEPTNAMTAKGVVKGYDKQTKFKPANMCTRAQMVTFIWRLAGEPKPKTAKCKFSDVKKTDYFYKACLWGNENHIVEGYKDGTFGPQIVCARRHAVTFLWRLAGTPKPSSSKNKFKDVKKSDYFYTATLWASEKKILAGYSDGTFRPNGDCLRRQMVTFLYKYEKFVNDK
ncbi:MAG: S-layer homology domain-containing protein [Clostridiales bacterium]|nr:S-layer homology domain-containing protein [Clostridiales bacterium]